MNTQKLKALSALFPSPDTNIYELTPTQIKRVCNRYPDLLYLSMMAARSQDFREKFVNFHLAQCDKITEPKARMVASILPIIITKDVDKTMLRGGILEFTAFYAEEFENFCTENWQEICEILESVVDRASTNCSSTAFGM